MNSNSSSYLQPDVASPPRRHSPPYTRGQVRRLGRRPAATGAPSSPNTPANPTQVPITRSAAPTPLPPLPPTPDNAAALAKGAAAVTALVGDHPRIQAVLLLHNGSILAEWYQPTADPPTAPQGIPHVLASLGRALVAAVAAQLLENGKLHPDAPVQQYVPELAGSSWEGATIRQLLSMRSGVTSYAVTMSAAMGFGPTATPESALLGLHSYLRGLPRDVPHGSGFQYRTGDTEVLAWACEGATGGRKMPDLVAELVWGPLGAEHDAAAMVDRHGVASIGSGLIATVRDIAKLGLATMPGSGQGHVVPQSFVRQLRYGPPEASGPVSMLGLMEVENYRNQHWVLDGAKGITLGYGFQGNFLYTHPEASLVAVVVAGWQGVENMHLVPEFVARLQRLADDLLRD